MTLNTFEQLLTMALLQKQNLPLHKIAVEATNDDITAVTEAAANLQYVKDYQTEAEVQKRAVTAIKNGMFDGESVSQAVAFPAFEPPHTLVANLKEEFQKRNRRFEDAAGYTRDIGISLGIVGEETGRFSPDETPVTFTASPAKTNYEAAIVVANRGKSDMWKTLGQRDGSNNVFEIQTSTGKSANVHIVPTEAGKPERLLITVQLYKNNEPYGQPSDPQYVTFNP